MGDSHCDFNHTHCVERGQLVCDLYVLLSSWDMEN